MRHLIKVSSIVVLCVSLYDSRAAEASIDQTALAKKLIIPRIRMGNATAQEALEFTKRKSQELDPAKKGVNLVFTNLPESATKLTYKAGGDPTLDPNTSVANAVNFDLADVSVFDVIQRVARVATLEVTARKGQSSFMQRGRSHKLPNSRC